MKRTLTILFSSMCLFALSNEVMAQQYDVPVPYATIGDAFAQINTDAAADPDNFRQATIMVAEGTVVEIDNSNGVSAPSGFVLTIQGAGADKTFVESFRGARPEAGEPDDLSTRFLELTSDDIEGNEIIIQDITFRYFGRGDNDNGGLISTSSSKANNLKISFINCVFDRCVAKQGAILHSSNGTLEFLMENCLITDCLAYGGSAFAGMIAVDNGGIYTIENCTFINNVRHPWDHRASEDNPVDKGAGRGGVISIGSGSSTIVFTMENTAFVNNLPLDLASDSIHPAFHIKAKDTVVNQITLVDNIFIGNRRPGHEATDIDILMPETSDITYTNSGNIANTVYYSADGEYVARDFDGFVINSDLTYTHEFIVFTMDGELPALLVDEYGIGHVEYMGDGLTEPVIENIQNLNSEDLTVFPNPSNGLFEIIMPKYSYTKSSFEVYNVAGSIVKRGTLSNSGNTYLDMTGAAKGMYILKLNSDTQVNVKRLIID